VGQTEPKMKLVGAYVQVFDNGKILWLGRPSRPETWKTLGAVVKDEQGENWRKKRNSKRPRLGSGSQMGKEKKRPWIAPGGESANQC